MLSAMSCKKVSSSALTIIHNVLEITDIWDIGSSDIMPLQTCHFFDILETNVALFLFPLLPSS